MIFPEKKPNCKGYMMLYNEMLKVLKELEKYNNAKLEALWELNKNEEK